jgi:hypothetical protein
MNGSRKPNRPMPTGAKNEEGRPQGQPSSEHCSAEACDRLHWQHVMRSTRYLCFERAAVDLGLTSMRESESDSARRLRLHQRAPIA